MTGSSGVPVKRVVACIDGTWFDEQGCCNTRYGNTSNIFRLWGAIRPGTFVHGNRSVKQVPFYESGTGYAKTPLDSFNDSMTTDGAAQQIDRVFEVHRPYRLEMSWDYGRLTFTIDSNVQVSYQLPPTNFGYMGTAVVHAIADIFHELGQAADQGQEQFVIKVQKLPSSRREAATKLYPYLEAKNMTAQPIIQFIGLFDSVKVSQIKHEKPFFRSVGAIRHALALTENRRAFQPSPYGPFTDAEDFARKSVVEAWFVGSHADIGGGSRDDGLSLYPLQWMMNESFQAGLVVDDKSGERYETMIEDPYSLVFPAVPQGENQETQPIRPWQFKYTNGLQVEMADLRATHRHGNIKASKGNTLKKKPKLTKAASKPESKEGKLSSPNLKKSSSESDAKKETSVKEKRKSGFKGLFSRKNKSNDAVAQPAAQPESAVETPAEVVQPAEQPAKAPARAHTVQINSGAALRTIMSGDRSVFKGDRLLGFIDDAPGGTVIHPSVFFVLDLYNRLGVGESLSSMMEPLDAFRRSSFMRRGRETLDPWIAESELGALGRGVLKDCRVLVCGRAGVGKSTLINKVFGFPVTKESYDDHGIHDIDEGFARDTFPGLIVHDSRGFQSGATEEVELLERFVKKRSSEADAAERLDAIWLCIDVPSTRTVHEADRKIFEVLDKYAQSVPIIIVRTMKDRFINEHLSLAREELREHGIRGDELDRLSDEKAQEAFNRVQEEDVNKLERSLGLAKDFAPFVYVAHRDAQSIRELVKKTISLVPDEGACLNLVAAQLVDVDEKINAAVEESVRLLNISNYTAMGGSTLMFGATISTPTISQVLCTNIVKCFGLTDLKSEEVAMLADHVLWSNLAKFLRQNLATTMLMFGAAAGLTLGTGFGGIPFLLGIPFAAVPPAARMIMKCATDIILILTAIFDNKGKAVQREDFEHASRLYAHKTLKEGTSIRLKVHKDIDKLIPVWHYKIHHPLKVSSMRTELRRMIRENRFSLDPDLFKDTKDRRESISDAGSNDSSKEAVDLEALLQWKNAEAASELAGDSTTEDRDQWRRPSELHGTTASPPAYADAEMLTENKVLINDPSLRRAKDNFGEAGGLPQPAVKVSSPTNEKTRTSLTPVPPGVVELPSNVAGGTPENPVELPTVMPTGPVPTLPPTIGGTIKRKAIPVRTISGPSELP